MNQKGFIDDDYIRAMVTIAAIGLCVGVALANAVPWLWGILKPLLHAATAHY